MKDGNLCHSGPALFESLHDTDNRIRDGEDVEKNNAYYRTIRFTIERSQGTAFSVRRFTYIVGCTQQVRFVASHVLWGAFFRKSPY